MFERIFILVVLAVLFWWAMVWISPKKTPTPKKPAQKVEGWGEHADDFYPGYLHSAWDTNTR